MSTKKWFVVTGSEEMGPLGPGGLRRLVKRGEIQKDTLLRREDHTETVMAVQVCGLLADDEPGPLPMLEPAESRPTHARQLARIYGPFTALRTLGWSTAATMFAFALLGAAGAAVAVWQLRFVADFETSMALVEEGDAMLFGIGVFAVISLIAVGGLFMWWIWTARVNLPHLINARIQNPPGWAVVAWLVPVINLVRPYLMVSEIDRLSAEAEADGDASVPANHTLLGLWWATALLGTALALSYMMANVGTIEDLRFAAWLHLGAGLCTMVSGILAGCIVLRITNNQERAHDRHPEPVELSREHRLRRVRAAAARPADQRRSGVRQLAP